MIPRALLFFVLVSVFATLAGSAVAQTAITVNTAPVGRREGRDDMTLAPTDINYDDCVADDFFEVTVKTTGTSATEPGLQVFTGTDAGCATAGGRITLGPLCWRVYNNPVVPLDPIQLPVQDIIPHAGADTGAHGTEQDCESAKQSTFTLYFILFEGDTQSSVAPATLAGKYDLIGPAAPHTTEVGIGDTRLYPAWDSSPEDSFGYRLYCEETDAEPDAGATTCVAPNLVAGMKPPKDVAANAQVSQLVTEGEVKGLTNHQQYACAVGTIDKLQNVGPLSNIICGTPVPVTGYFKLYRESGGQAGGGFCAFGRGLSGRSASLAALGLTALFFAARRRGRRGDTR